MTTEPVRVGRRSRDYLHLEEHERGSRRLFSFLSAIAISFFILMGVSLAQKTKIEEVTLPMEDLRAVYLPDPPPPPPRVGKEVAPPEWVLSLSEAPSTDGFRIAAAPPSIRPVSSPVAVPDLSFDLEAFSPDRDSVQYDADHVFRLSEVDQAPLAVYQKAPVLPPGTLDGVADPRVTLMFIIQDDGSIDSIKVLQSASEKLDAIIVRTVKEWKFKPAVRQGKRVACWVQQSFYFSRKVVKQAGFKDFR
ncbi:MAG: TonB family protein [Opitutaceae bacterium]